MKRANRFADRHLLVAYYWHLYQHHARRYAYCKQQQREAESCDRRALIEYWRGRALWSDKRLLDTMQQLDTLYPRWRCYLDTQTEEIVNV